MSGTLRFNASPGHLFDFAGQIPSAPQGVAMGGTSAPTVSGTYTGKTNDNYTFEVLGSGTIGVTPGLTLQVRNSANTVVSSVNVGEGYNAGGPIEIRNGLSLRLSPGTTANGTFQVPVTANADTANLLPALGVGGLFTGTSASSIAVRSDIKANPTLLATSRSGLAGETSNLSRLSNLRDERLLSNGQQTFRQFYGETIGIVGANVATLDTLQTAQSNLQQNIEAQEQSFTGVDINEEMVNLLTFQRMVESASKYLTVVNRALDAVLEMAQ